MVPIRSTSQVYGSFLPEKKLIDILHRRRHNKNSMIHVIREGMSKTRWVVTKHQISKSDYILAGGKLHNDRSYVNTTVSRCHMGSVTLQGRKTTEHDVAFAVDSVLNYVAHRDSFAVDQVVTLSIYHINSTA